MSKVYDQHKAAFANVGAYVILHNGERVATIAFKYGQAVTAYVHWLGVEMVKGRAGGGGYDRASAACYSAVYRKNGATMHPDSGKVWSDGSPMRSPEEIDAYGAFILALLKNDGHSWSRNLEDSGFTVLSAV